MTTSAFNSEASSGPAFYQAARPESADQRKLNAHVHVPLKDAIKGGTCSVMEWAGRYTLHADFCEDHQAKTVLPALERAGFSSGDTNLQSVMRPEDYAKRSIGFVMGALEQGIKPPGGQVFARWFGEYKDRLELQKTGRRPVRKQAASPGFPKNPFLWLRQFF